MILGLDVGGTFIKYAWIDEMGNLQDAGKEPTPLTNQGDFIAVIQKIWNQRDCDKEGIAISLPGTIDPQSGFVYQGGSLTYNHRCNVLEILQEALHTSVSIENDARCAAIAEKTSGNMQEIKNGVVLVFGTGIGGCFIINDDIYRGSHLFAGEVSVLLCKDLERNGMDALFGNICGIPAFANRVKEAKGVKEASGEDVFAWIEQGDEIATSMFTSFCKEVVTQLFNLQLILDPTRVCIGGGVSQNPLFVQSIQTAMEAFYEHLPIAMPHLEIFPCQYQADANILGAYYHFLHQHPDH